MASVEVDEDAAIVLMGSWGRREVTSESDDDFMVLLVAAPRENALPSIEEVAEALGGRPPGPEEIFGRQVLLDELRGKVGRDEDTNANLTRRMLLMLESVAICGDSVHGDARRAYCRLPRGKRQGPQAAEVPAQRPRPLLEDDCGRL